LTSAGSACTSTRSSRWEAVLARQRFARGVEVIPERIQSKRDVREAEIADRHGEGRVVDSDPLHARNGWAFLHAVVVEQGLEDGDGPFHSGVESLIDRAFPNSSDAHAQHPNQRRAKAGESIYRAKGRLSGEIITGHFRRRLSTRESQSTESG